MGVFLVDDWYSLIFVMDGTKILDKGCFSKIIIKIRRPKRLYKLTHHTGNLTTLSDVASMMPLFTTPISIDDLNCNTGMAAILLEAEITDQRSNPGTMRKKQERRQLAGLTKQVETKTREKQRSFMI
jgi:hypothetical protein